MRQGAGVLGVFVGGVGEWGAEGAAAVGEDGSWVLEESGLVSCPVPASAFLSLSLPAESLQQALLA